MDKQSPNQQINVSGGSTATHITQNLHVGDVNHFHSDEKSATSDILDLARYREKSLRVFAAQPRPLTLPMAQAVTEPSPESQPEGDLVADVITELERNSRVVLVGAAGSGKTTLLRHAAYLYAETALERPHATSACVFIDLTRLCFTDRHSPLRSLLELISDSLFENHASIAPPSVTAVSKFLEHGGVRVLLDGLDEVSGTSRQKSCVQGIELLAQRFPKNTYVLGARSIAWPLRHWRNLSLMELTNEQISMVISQYAGAAASAATSGSVVEHLDALRTPLHVTMATELLLKSRTGLELEHYSRSQLIHAYVNDLLGRASAGEPGVSEATLRQLLRDLAYRQKVKSTLLTKEDTELWLVQQLAESSKANRALKILCDVGLLICEREHVRFKHQTLWEYFYAANLIVKWRSSSDCERPPFVPGWFRREIKNVENAPRLLHLLPQLLDEEIAVILLIAEKSNPALGMMWSDDLCLGQRRTSAVDNFLRSMSKRLWRTTWGMRFVDTADDIRREFFSPTAMKWIPLLATFPGSYWLVLIPTVISLLISFGLPLLTSGKTEESFLYVRHIAQLKSSALRQEFICILQSSISAIPKSSRLYAFAMLITKDVSMDLVAQLRSAPAPYSAIKALALQRTHSSLEVLLALIHANNVYALGALESLEQRARLNPDERNHIKEKLMLLLSRQELADYVMTKVRGVLGTCDNPEIRVFSSTAMQVLGHIALVCGGVAVFNFLLILMTGYMVVFLPALTYLVFGVGMNVFSGLFTASAGALWLERRMSHAGVIRIRGYYGIDGLGAVGYAMAVFFFLPLAFPLLLVWKRIMANARGVDWDGLQIAFRKAQETVVSEPTGGP